MSPARPREASTWKKRNEPFYLSLSLFPFFPYHHPPFFISYYSLNPLVVHSSHALLSFLLLLLLPPSPLFHRFIVPFPFQRTLLYGGTIARRGRQVEETGKRQVAAGRYIHDAGDDGEKQQWPVAAIPRHETQCVLIPPNLYSRRTKVNDESVLVSRSVTSNLVIKKCCIREFNSAIFRVNIRDKISIVRFLGFLMEERNKNSTTLR